MTIDRNPRSRKAGEDRLSDAIAYRALWNFRRP
jgi:hypothetical protein